MIPVKLAAEPINFDLDVRQKGLNALAELVGEAVPPRAGRKRTKIADSRDKIPGSKYPPIWTVALPDMLQAYDRKCAYLGLHIEYGTGSPSVDHMRPKSKKWEQAYEWSNFRLSSTTINSKKSNLELILDPFLIEDGTFAIEFIGFQVKPGPIAIKDLLTKANSAIKVLGLNSPNCCKARQEYFVNYELGPGNGGIDLAYLERRAPFIAQELRRQNLLLRGDV